MFRKFFAVALLLILVAVCSKRTYDSPSMSKLPNTCAAPQFAVAVDAFEELQEQRDEALGRIEKLTIEEPLEYVKRWEAELARLRELGSRADAVRAPRCLEHAKSLFVRYLAETANAAALRAPDKDPVDYRRARESAEGIRGQYRAEVRLQEPNRQ